ncbi:putative baseplate assembly protein [Amycolatopsis sp. cg5]|uniref:putative baseplate assembly protein n=1 Tax=Amycolatopsis sp. cg5 TaxID=3238802 RepID=UPI003525AAF3
MNGCGCATCTGIAVETPLTVVNPPGLSALARRVGTHGEFFATMLARLSSPAYPALSGLTVRTTDDPAIGLLDSAASLADLLTFHLERIASEGYLRTATEEGSLALLGRLVGYLPRPGVSAGTYLAYTLDADPRPGHDLRSTIPQGARAQSVPGPGEEPQSFESMDELAARWSWNDLKVRQRQPFQLTKTGMDTRTNVQLAGVSNNIKPGDRLLYVFGTERDRQVLDVVSEVVLDRENNITTVVRQAEPLPDLASMRKKLRDLLNPIIEDPEPVVRRSSILKKFVEGVLKPLHAIAGKNGDDKAVPPVPEDPGKLTSPTKYLHALGKVLERLAEEIELTAHYAHINEWLVALQNNLAACEKGVQKLEPDQPDDAAESLFRALALDKPNPTSPAVLGLGALLGALRTSPNRPPASSRQLKRDLAKLYGPGSDLGAQLLTALDPRVGEGLYTAWRQVDLAAPLALQELQAMRQVATPFGATAPLRTTRDGKPITPEDWELEGQQALTLTVTYDEKPKPPPDPDDPVEPPGPKDTPKSASVRFLLGANTWPGEIRKLTEDGSLAIGPGEVEYTIDERTGEITFVFGGGIPGHTIVVSKEDKATKKVKVTASGVFAGSVERDLALDEAFGPFFMFEPKTNRLIIVNLRRQTEKNEPFVEINFATTTRFPANVLTLDAVYEGVGVGSWVVIERPTKRAKPLQLVTARVTGVRVLAKQAFGISGKVTELALDRPWLDDSDTRLTEIRDTSIYLRGDRLALADEPITDEVRDKEIELAELYDGLTPGRWVIVTGERTDLPGSPAGVKGTELAMLAGVQQVVEPTRPGELVHTKIALVGGLAYRYKRETVHVYANVVRATHGAGRDEPIGSGDASKPSQSFQLRQGPLTWLASDDPLGATSTLEVRVDGVRWHEVDSFAGRGPEEQVYVTETAEHDAVRVTFGDGKHGARLPTGVENVRARYRVGLGKAGNVATGRITQLTTRPLGVSGVDNPLPATGGADRDDASLLRRNIPLRVTAFERLVSVPDFEDFAKARAGVGRASARRLFNGTRQIVHVTVAGADDIALQEDSDIVTTLRTALSEQGDPSTPTDVAVREAVLLVISANIRVHPDHDWETVEPAVRAALTARLGFRNRELGQPAYLSEVLAIAQAVPGVDYVDVDVFAGVPGGITPVGLDGLLETLDEPRTVVPARLAEYDETVYRVDPPPGEPTETLTAIAAKHGITVAELGRLNPDLTEATPLPRGRKVIVFRGVRPAQLAVVSAAVPDTVILKEVRS